MFTCGMYESDITPALGMKIPGYFERRLASGIRDRLAVSVLYCAREDVQAVLVSCDAIGVPMAVCDRARQRISVRSRRRCGSA